MNIIFQELKYYRKSTIIWTASLSLLIVVFLSIFPAFMKDVEATRKLLSNLPPAVRAAAGIQLDSFFTFIGFYTYIFLYVILAGSVQAMNLGVSVISKENTYKTADFLLTKPITRTKVIVSKALAVLVLTIITNIVYITISVSAAKAISTEPFSLKIFILISATLFLIQLMFLAIGLLFSVIIPKVKSVLSVSLPVVFAFFIIGMLDSIIGYKTVRYFTPFKFFDVSYIIGHGFFEIKFLILELVLVSIFAGAAYVIFIKKDIPSVA